jgi:hypothetical protein
LQLSAFFVVWLGAEWRSISSESLWQIYRDGDHFWPFWEINFWQIYCWAISAAANWPQAPSISRPRVSRTVTGTP